MLDKAVLAQYTDSNDLNYYFNVDNIPNQDLVLDTYTYFNEGGGEKYFSPLLFFNLLNWHLTFIKNNISRPVDLMEHFKIINISDIERHILVGFVLKWYGGIPINNMNPQYNVTLKLIEKIYTAFLQMAKDELQGLANLSLSHNLTSIEEAKLLEYKTCQDNLLFLNNLDRIITFQKKIETSNQSTIATKENLILKKENIELKELFSESLAKLNSAKRLRIFQYYSVWLIFIGAAFTLGIYLGNFKFDNDKINMYNKNLQKDKIIDSLNKIISQHNKRQDSAMSLKKYNLSTHPNFKNETNRSFDIK